MASRTTLIREMIRRQHGVLKLRPEFVRRFYPDLNRLGQSRMRKSMRDFIPERWIGSSVQAINPPPLPGGGLSMLDDIDRTSKPLSLRDAVRAAPVEMIGESLLAAHGAEFRVLVKLLDPADAIVFHLHATDAQVKRMPHHFRGHRFGKDEAYYFLEAPKGHSPYTHAGLYPGVTRRELIEAVRRGRDHALELSPSFYQEFETGFFLPAGIPHRPGSALTLEVQQPSDVYTLLETESAGRPMPPRQIHPGFKSLEEAFDLIDMKLAEKVGKLDGNRLVPESREVHGGQIATIFPGNLCRTFEGARLRISSRLTHQPGGAIVTLIWRGSGRINGRRVRAGDEFFVTHDSAVRGIEMESTGDEPLELFTFNPVA